MKAVERESFGRHIEKCPSAELREKLITEYAPLVKVVAGQCLEYVSGI